MSKQIDEALEALELIARGTDHKYPMEHVKIRKALERQRDENQTLRGLLEAVLSATESERKVRRIAAKYAIDFDEPLDVDEYQMGFKAALRELGQPVPEDQ